jgi:hypothetical protein
MSSKTQSSNDLFALKHAANTGWSQNNTTISSIICCCGCCCCCCLVVGMSSSARAIGRPRSGSGSNREPLQLPRGSNSPPVAARPNTISSSPVRELVLCGRFATCRGAQTLTITQKLVGAPQLVRFGRYDALAV